MLNAALLIVLTSLIIAAFTMPFFGLTNATCCDDEAMKWGELTRSFAKWAILLIVLIPSAVCAYFYGAEHSRLLQLISMLLSPFGLVGGILYPLWIVHILQQHRPQVQY